MIRMFAILAIVLSGIPGLGIGLSRAQALGSACSASGCPQVVIETSCCGKPVETSFCPMSGGPCTCAAAPMPDQPSRPETPLPRTDRDSITGLPNGPPQAGLVVEPVDVTPVLASLVGGLCAGKTHNEVQAFLSIWHR